MDIYPAAAELLREQCWLNQPLSTSFSLDNH